MDHLARQRPRLEQSRQLPPKIKVARWQCFDPGVHHVSTDTAIDMYLIGVALRQMDVRLAVDGRTLVDGTVMPGALCVTTPGAATAALFRGPYDVLYLHVPTPHIADGSHNPNWPALQSQMLAQPDPVAESLAQALLGASQLGDGFAPLYGEALAMALVARVRASLAAGPSATHLRVAPLPKWRLQRVIDYVAANLSRPIRLADLATATGLTRMHFAAQFRAATGLRPHEYLLRRRIERAQELLARSPAPVAEVAQEVGFQSQGHFTNVFKQFAGRPPQAWRHRNSRTA